MRKKKMDIFVIIKNDILNNIKSYIVVLIIFVIGIFLGVMFINQLENKEKIENYIKTYIDETKMIQNGDYLRELKDDIKNKIILVILLWISGTTIIGLPILLGIILLRGFSFGYTIASCVYSLGKIRAILFMGITIFLQNIIFIPSIMILGVSGIELYKSIVKAKQKENIKLAIIKHTILSLIILFFFIISSVIKAEISYRLLINFIKYF